jgi:hypothetical protein
MYVGPLIQARQQGAFFAACLQEDSEVSREGDFKSRIDPLAAQIAESLLSASTAPTLRAPGDKPLSTTGRPPAVEMKTIRGCEIRISKGRFMAAKDELERLGRVLQVQALPEIIFAQSSISIRLKDLELTLNAEVYLQSAAQYFMTQAYKEESAEITVPQAELWKKTLETHAVFESGIDWAFRSKCLGHWTRSGEEIAPISSSERIDFTELRRTDLPILLFSALDLFEDDLHDHGCSNLHLKFRATESYFFVLLRHLVRIDRKITVLRETRIFHLFGAPKVVLEYTLKKTHVDGQVITPENVDQISGQIPATSSEVFEVSLQ